MPPKPSPPSAGKPSKRRASDASGLQQSDLRDAFGASPKHARRGSLSSEDPLEVQVTPRQYDAFTVKFLETEGTARGFSAADREEDSRRSGEARERRRRFAKRQADEPSLGSSGRRGGRAIFKSRVFFRSPGISTRSLTSSNQPLATTSTRLPPLTETEFVAAFDVLLRNHREFVPPQHFLERLTHILLRRRERVARSVFQRDDDYDDDDDDDGGRVKHDKQKETNASLAAREDDRLLRATAEIFRRVNAQHPAALAARFDSSSESPTGSNPGWTPGKAHVRVGVRTWTPLDSDRRAGSIREHGSEHGSVFETNASRDARVSGWRARGARADWNRFAALLGAARGDSERLDALVDPGASGADSRGAEAKRAASVAARAEGRGARANRRNAYADADFALDAKDAKTKTKTGEEETSDDSDEDSDSDEVAPLGVALLFAHAVDVLVQDAHARVEVFESRVRERAAERARLAAETAAATPPPASARHPRAGADESPVPDSQPTPSSDPDQTRQDTSALPSGAWAGDLLRNALVYRLVGNHAPSDAERTRLFRDLLELAGAAARRAANDARRGASRDALNPSTIDSKSSIAREDASLESLGHAAASLLSAFDDVLSALHAFGATRGDRAAEKLRTQLDEARVRYFRADRRNLRAAGAKKAFLDAVAVAGGQEETRALRVVRGALREKVTARRAPGLMRPGLGATAGASGALDVLRYVSDDVKDAVKCVETEDASTRRAEACDAVAHFAAAAAKAAARVVGREEGIARQRASRKTCADAFRLTHERFAEEARAGDALTAESAAAMDAAAGTLRCYE